MLYIPGMCVISLHTQTKLLLFYDINPLSLLLYSTIENNKKKKLRPLNKNIIGKAGLLPLRIINRSYMIILTCLFSNLLTLILSVNTLNTLIHVNK